MVIDCFQYKVYQDNFVIKKKWLYKNHTHSAHTFKKVNHPQARMMNLQSIRLICLDTYLHSRDLAHFMNYVSECDNNQSALIDSTLISFFSSRMVL